MIAIIAGTGNLPIEACKNFINKKQNFFVISLFPQDNKKKIQDLIKDNNLIVAQKFYKAAQILKILQDRKTKKVLFIGKVDKRNLLKNFKLDWMSIKFLASLVSKSDTTIMEKLVKIFNDHGMEIISQKDVLQSLIIPPGILTGKIDKNLQENIDFGLQIAQKISENDIGQTVIIKDMMILAVEAIEGTDNCIKRGIELGKENIIICKAAKKNQNKKFDLPTLGPNSLEDIKKGQVQVIAWQSSQTFISQKDEFIKRAKELGITLLSV